LQERQDDTDDEQARADAKAPGEDAQSGVVKRRQALSAFFQ
jgi:hypothetical protein